MEDKTFMGKIVAVLSSVRFWIVTLTGILALLNGQPVIETVQVWLAAIAVIGTLDSVASRVGGKV